MYAHRLVISYKGSNYFGWQDLGSNEDKPSIESKISQVLKKICKYQNITIAAASRTDAGVHAQGQVLKVTLPLDITSENLLRGMNSLLPDDIRVLQAEPCSAAFNPNKESQNKTYHYYFSTDDIHNPVMNEMLAHIPSSGTNPLDIAHMQEACALFVGEHDFYSFAKRDTAKPSTLRTILSCELLETPSPFGSKVYTIKIVGTGFLRYMIRYIAGALFAVGRKEISLNDISEALATRKEEKLTSRAKARGLHLMHISYP